MSISTSSIKEELQTQFCSPRKCNCNRYHRQLDYTVANPLTDLEKLLIPLVQSQKNLNESETRNFRLGFSQPMHELPKPLLSKSVELTKLQETGSQTKIMSIKRIKVTKVAIFYFQPDRRVPEYRDASQVTRVK